MNQTINNLFKFVLIVACTHSLFAVDSDNAGGKEMFISFEDSQAALPDKEYYKPQDPVTTRSAPDWTDGNPDWYGAYEFPATMTAAVSNEGVQLSDTNDILGAFDDSGNVRGISTALNVSFGPYQGTVVHEIGLWSNNAGDNLTFKFYDASEDAILDISEDYTFAINDVVGSMVAPHALNAGAPDLSCPECSDAGGLPWDCATAVAMFGCDFAWGADATIADFCQATCGGCPEEDACGVCEGDGSSCTDCAGVVDGDAEEDCFGTCNGDAIIDCAGSCLPGSILSWQGDGYCDDGAWGVDFVSCGDFNCDDGDCGTELVDGECVSSCSFFDCTGQCADGYESYLGDGWCDGTDMAWGLDFSCYDCDNGDCNDECGACEGDGIADGACDCDGNVDAGCGCGEAGPSGCDNQCGSTAELDDCGVCDGGNADDLGCGCFEAGPSGCDNQCGSTLEDDECGICGGDSSSCADCAGTPNGDSELDDCGVCDGGNADDLGCGCFEAGPSGCDNACGSTLEDDECGVCGGDSSSCADCAGVPNGDSVEDCAGECDGSAVVDGCGVCNGDGSSCTYGVEQSMEQAFYYFNTASLDGAELSAEDWIVARNPESGVLVAAAQYIPTNGDVIEVVVMGEELIDVQGWTCDSGPINTCGMMMSGQTPQFYVFDSSSPLESIAQYTATDETVLQNIPAYEGNGMYTGLTLNLVTDCQGDMGGAAITSGDCGDCWGGNTGLDEDWNNTDGDSLCNFGSPNGEEDNCPNTDNEDQADNDNDSGNGVDDGDDATGGDACDNDDDNDTCADEVDDAQMEWDDDYDSDGTADDCDDDDDNDGAADDVESDDNN